MSIKTSPITRTAIASYLQTFLLSRKKYILLPHTTLNELLEIEKNAVIPDDENPGFGYYTIGKSGHTSSIVGTEDDVIIDLRKHSPADAACWGHIPFVLREEANDLSADLRLQYGLRRMETYGTKNYFAYYAKRIDLALFVPKVKITNIVNGVANTKDYLYTQSNLHPEIPTVLPDEVTTTAAEYLSVTMPVTVEFSQFDVQELNNMALIKFGDARRAVISEIALCSGIDRVVQTTTAGGAPINFKEIIASQVLTFISTYRQMSIDNKGFTMDLELGATEPLLTSSNLTDAQMNDLIARARSGLLSGVTITPNQ